MKISVLTICPEQFGDFAKTPLISRAIQSSRLELEIVDIRGFADGCFRKVDDSPYGGGAGMIMRCAPVLDALRAVRTPQSHVIALTPTGKIYRQEDARRLSGISHLVLICGHFEGMDERIYSHVDERLSIGDYILTGGELAAMVVADSVMRLVKGGIREESLKEESFEDGLLEYPQYTRPPEYQGQKVPQVLLSGNHEAIRKWRQQEARKMTEQLRPDLLEHLS